MEVVPLLHPTEDNLKRGLRALPLTFIQGVLVHIQSCAALPPSVDNEWFVDRLLHEIEDVGIELFVQKLDPETVQESCSLLNLGANEEEVSQLQVSLEAYAKERRVHAFLESLETEILERYCNDLKIHHNSAAPKEDIEDTLSAEILLLGLEGLLDFLSVTMLREYYAALHIKNNTVPQVLKKPQLIEEIVRHSFNTRFELNTLRVKSEPVDNTYNETEEKSSDDENDPDYVPPNDELRDSGDQRREPPATPKTPYATPRRLTASEVQRTTPRKELDRMLVKDLRGYLQTQGLKYDDKRSVLLNRIMRHHKTAGDAGPPTPLDETALVSLDNNSNLDSESEGSMDGRELTTKKSKRLHDMEPIPSSSSSTRKKARNAL